MRLNNLKIKTKLVIIYILCVLVPLIATNLFINVSIKQSVEKEQISALENAASRIEYNIEENINSALLVSDYLCMDTELNRFLKERYVDGSDYYSHFYRLMKDNVIRYYYTVQSIYNITVCTNNNTITNGSYFFKVRDIENTKWYQDYQNAKKDIALSSYYDAKNNYAKYIERAKHICVLRRMNESEDVLKIDLDYVKLGDSIKSESGGADVYLVQDDKIIYSTVNLGYGDEDFKPMSAYQKREIEYVKQVDLPGGDMQIYITDDVPGVLSELLKNKALILALFLVNLVLPSIVIVLVNRSFHDRIVLTEQYIKKVENGEFEEMVCHEGSDEIGNLIRSYNLMAVKIKELFEVVYRKNVEQQALMISRKQAELNALQSQVNPHFMFNTLDSIRMRSLVKGELQTADILEKFARLIRRVIYWDEDFVTIREEAAYIRNYLDIQKYRFADRLNFQIHVQENCMDFKIPKFSLLNFVENACVHGIERRIEGGDITVIVSRDEENIFLEIMDSGEGMREEELEELREKIENATMKDLNESKSIGVLNTVIRLKLYYGEDIKIDMNSTRGEGTEVCVMLPLTCNENLKNS